MLAQGSRALPKVRRLVETVTGFAGKFEEMQVWQVKAKLRERIGTGWKTQGAEMLQELVDDTPTLLLIDELSILVSTMARNAGGTEEATDLLHWLRSLRQQFAGKLSMVIGSSLGIGRVASQLSVTRNLTALRRAAGGRPRSGGGG